MRLDKFISNSTDYSRTQVRRAIKMGQITVNERTAKSASQNVNDEDHISLEGHHIKPPGPRYFMLHKPLDYVCANKDSEHSTVIDLLDEIRQDQLQIVGRLDIDTTGLVLITDDGQWNHRITSPRSQCDKVYHVTTSEPIESSYMAQFEQGIQLESENKPTLPALLNLDPNSEKQAALTLREGKYHQVKRMFAALGNHVEALHRHSIGAIELDPNLPCGEYRPLTQAEIDSIQ